MYLFDFIPYLKAHFNFFCHVLFKLSSESFSPLYLVHPRISCSWSRVQDGVLGGWVEWWRRGRSKKRLGSILPSLNCIPCPLLSSRLLLWGSPQRCGMPAALVCRGLALCATQVVRVGGHSPPEASTSALCNWDQPPSNRNPQCTK